MNVLETFLDGLDEKVIDHLKPAIDELKTARAELMNLSPAFRKTIIRVFNRVAIDILKLFKQYSLQKDQELHEVWFEYFGVNL